MSDHAACVLDEEWAMRAMTGFAKSPSILKKCLALRWWISVHPSTTTMSHKQYNTKNSLNNRGGLWPQANTRYLSLLSPGTLPASKAPTGYKKCAYSPLVILSAETRTMGQINQITSKHSSQIPVCWMIWPVAIFWISRMQSWNSLRKWRSVICMLNPRPTQAASFHLPSRVAGPALSFKTGGPILPELDWFNNASYKCAVL